VETDLVKATFEVGSFPIRVRFTPDGRRVLVSDAALNELIVIDVATCEVVRRIPTGDMPVGILVEPDGRRAWVAATMADEVIVIDLEKLEMVGTISPGATPDGMAWAIMGREKNDE
jgi:YVTN family beta-propeller protein